MDEKVLTKCAEPGCARRFLPSAAIPSVAIEFNGAFFSVPKGDPASEILFGTFGFGRFLGPLLVLSPYEAYFLTLAVGGDRGRVWAQCCAMCGAGAFPVRYAVYHHYRCLLWVVRDGSLFGADFVLYSDHPDLVHSSYAVAVVDSWDGAEEEARALSRVAWNVKKAVVLVKVARNEDLDMSNPECIGKMEIEAVSLKRVKYN